MTYLIDFFSFQCSALVFLESVNQVSRVKRLYGVRKGKMRVLMTGVDENRFRDLKFQAFSRQMGDRPVFEVLFRGGPQSESGLDKIKYLLESHILDSSTFLNIISPSFQTNGREIVKFSASNSLVSDQEIVNAYGAANLVIGQISNHKRLRYTVPHRFYESAFFGRPYLTGPLPDIGCPLPLESLLILGRNSTDEVVSALNFASQSKLDLVEKGINLKTWYEANCTQVILASHFYNYVKTFFPF
jgi:hypothetical protein